MDSTRIAALSAWIASHPHAAGAVIFAAAFLDSLLVIGAAVPAIPIFFAVGTLVGLGSIDGPYAIVAAGAGAFCGDGISYLLGRRYGERMRTLWPFSRYPDWLQRGESMFERHGAIGLLIARYVGAVRPFVPAIAGMLGMPARRYAAVSAVAGLSWAALFIGPGWLFGASMEVLSAIAGRLSLLVLAVLAVLLGAGWLIVHLYGLLAPRASALVGAALRWSHRHPHLGRWSRGLVDPQHPESTSLAWFAATLAVAGAASAWLLTALALPAHGLDLDARVAAFILQLRSPLADPLMAWLAGIADARLLAALGLATALLLALGRHRLAAAHLLAALAFGLVFDGVFSHLLDLPAFAGTTLAAQVGLLAVLLARDLPGRHRIGPYVAGGLLLSLPLLAALYLGDERLSTLLVRSGAGLAWAAALGLGFRQRHATLPRMPRWALLWLLVLLLGHGLRPLSPALPPALAEQVLSRADWLDHGWSLLPATREDFTAAQPASLDLQYAGSPDALAATLAAEGWQRLDPPGWAALFATLDGGLDAVHASPLPAAHLGHREVLLLRRADPGQPDSQQVLRLWPSALRLDDGTPVWQGAVMRLHFEERLGLFRGWFPHRDDLHGLPLADAQLPSGWLRSERSGRAGPVQLIAASAGEFR